jgi:hypothetical protein
MTIVLIIVGAVVLGLVALRFITGMIKFAVLAVVVLAAFLIVRQAGGF